MTTNMLLMLGAFAFGAAFSAFGNNSASFPTIRIDHAGDSSLLPSSCEISFAGGAPILRDLSSPKQGITRGTAIIFDSRDKTAAASVVLSFLRTASISDKSGTSLRLTTEVTRTGSGYQFAKEARVQAFALDQIGRGIEVLSELDTPLVAVVQLSEMTTMDPVTAPAADRAPINLGGLQGDGKILAIDGNNGFVNEHGARIAPAALNFYLSRFAPNRASRFTIVYRSPDDEIAAKSLSAKLLEKGYDNTAVEFREAIMKSEESTKPLPAAKLPPKPPIALDPVLATRQIPAKAGPPTLLVDKPSRGEWTPDAALPPSTHQDGAAGAISKAIHYGELFSQSVDEAGKTFSDTELNSKAVRAIISRLHGYQSTVGSPCPQCGKGRLTLSTGKNGSFFVCDELPLCKFTSNHSIQGRKDHD